MQRGVMILISKQLLDIVAVAIQFGIFFYLFLSFFFSFCAGIHRCHINISSVHDGGLRLLQHVGVVESSVCESRFDSAQLRCVGGRTEAGVIAPKIANISPSSEIPVGMWLP